MNHRWVVLLAWTSAVVGLLLACQRSEVRFPHLDHLTAACGGPGQPACLTCSSCHGNMDESTQTTPPWVRTCTECHENGVSLMNRSLRFARAAAERPDRILFPHNRHLALPRIGGQCVHCHGGVVDPKARHVRSPPMSACLTCHQRDFEQVNCTPCHIREELSRLEPQTFLRHDAMWLERHGIAAARQSQVCGACHSATWCADCHDQNRGLLLETRRPDSIERQFKHVGNFLVRHTIEARSRPDTCIRCHSSESCNGCHILRGVSAARLGAVSPHPPGWLGRDRSSRNFHGRAARRDPLSCMACHDNGPATNCIQCHRVGAAAGNPHPSGWKSSRSTHDSMCRYCHVQ